MKNCANIQALADELGIHRRLLYVWRDKLAPQNGAASPPESTREHDLERQVERLKRALADKTLEVDFFSGALQKIQARRQSDSATGETLSTSKSGK